MTLRSLWDGVRIADAPLSFAGLSIGARMTVLELGQGALVHSPLPLTDELREAVHSARFVLAPNLFHHLYVKSWAETGAALWAAPGLEKKRSDVPFVGTVAAGENPFGSEIEALTLSCFSLSNEVAVLHKPSRTLVVTDLLFNLPESAPGFTRFAFRLLGGYPGVRSTHLERLLMKRAQARADLEHILSWEFDRVVMSHGEVVGSGGKDRVREAFGWLW